jgi:hypothetical protein
VLDAALRSDPVEWDVPDSPLTDVDILATAWSDGVRQASQYGPRIEIRDHVPMDDAIVASRRLRSRAVRASSVYVARDWRTAHDTWHWPLRIRILSGPRGEQAGIGLDLGTRVDVLDPGDPDAADLMLAFMDLPTAAARLDREPTLDASALIVLGDYSDDGASLQAVVEAVRREVRARAVALVAGPRDVASWIEHFVDDLALDLSLDQALSGVPYGSNAPAPLVFGARGFLRQARLRATTLGMARRLEALPRDLELPVERYLRSLEEPPREEHNRGFGPIFTGDRVVVGSGGSSPLGHAEHLARLAREPRLAMANGGSVDLADYERTVVRPAEDEAATGGAEDRFLQAQVATKSVGGDIVERELATATDYWLRVRVAAAEAADGWTEFGERFPFEVLPAGMASYTLTVSFVQLSPRRNVQTGTVELPATGASSRTAFPIRTPDDATDVEGRLVVLHRGRILQTARITLHVGEADSVGDLSPISRTREADVRRDLARLGRRRRFGAAFVLNHHEGDGLVAGFGDSVGDVLPVDDIGAGVKEMTKLLVKHAKSAKQAPPLSDDASVALLVGLARQGKPLYDALVFGRPWEAAAKKNPRLQVVSVNRNAYLPFELLYERRRAPRKRASLCPNATAELASGDASGCPTLGPNAAEYVCPLGFWGLSKVIERHVTDAPIEGGALARFYAEPTSHRSKLSVLTTALGAASDRVDTVEAGGTDLVKAALTRVSTPNSWVAGWTEWQTTVGGADSTLLFAIPHTGPSGGELAMELGGKFLARPDFDDTYVRRAGATGPGPLVVLLGCETRLAPIAYQDFASAFRLYGASIVISTVATVLGRHAVPVAVSLLDELKAWSARDGGTVGDAMTAMRRAMVAKGIVIAMALTAYGDADWRLTT